MSSLVPCACWVPKGAAKEVPDKVQLTRHEIQKLLKGAERQLKNLGIEAEESDDGDVDQDQLEKGEGKEGEEEEGGQGGQRTADDHVSVEELYELENYDSDGSGEGGQSVSGAGMGNSLAGLTYYASNEDDPYITLKDVPPEDDEADDDRILPTDNLLAIGRAEEDYSSVEIHGEPTRTGFHGKVEAERSGWSLSGVEPKNLKINQEPYELHRESDVHAYSHHEILLSAFPLSLEWMDFDPEQPDKKGNYLAVGMMSPAIEVWDLDIVDGPEPVFTLGESIRKGATRKKPTRYVKVEKKKKKKPGATSDPEVGEELSPKPVDGHTDSVLGLSWNRIVRNILASASADNTVKVWDMAWPKCVLTVPHPNKVQCLQWHPYEPELLATGAFDRAVRLFNCKSPEKPVRRWTVDGEVEKVLWNHFKPELLLVSTEGKMVWCLNKDSGDAVFQLHAHTDAVTDISLSCHAPGLLVTASTDDTIKFWDVQDDAPVFLLSKDMHMGSVLCAQFCVDSPYTLAVGGQKNGFHLIHVGSLPAVMQRFEGRSLLMAVTSNAESSTAQLPSDPQDREGEGDGDTSMEVEVDSTSEQGSISAPSDSDSVAMKSAKSKSRPKLKKGTSSGKAKKKRIH